MSALAVNRSARPERELELADSLAALRSRLAAAAEAAGRKLDEIQLLPITKFFPATDVAILSRLGCAAFGESRDQEAAAKVDEVARLLDGPAGAGAASAGPHWHMVGKIQRNKARSLAGWAHTAHSVSSTRVVAALDHAVAGALSEGRRKNPLRVYVQISLDGDVSRGGVDVSDAGAVDEICAQADAAESLELVGLMGYTAAGLGAGSGVRAAAVGTPSGASGPPGRGRIVGGYVERPRNCGQTWFDVCACRYRVIGSTTATVTVSSHSSHIFITDTGIPRAVEGSSDEHTAQGQGLLRHGSHGGLRRRVLRRSRAGAGAATRGSGSPTTDTAVTRVASTTIRAARPPSTARAAIAAATPTSLVSAAPTTTAPTWVGRDFGSLRGSTRGALAMDPRRMAMLFDESSPLSKITTLRPKDYSEARTIGERFRDGTPVIMDLVSMDNADAKRLVDFAAGLAFALRGSFDKVATKVFLLSPADVDVSPEERRRIAETGFYAYQ